jgi:hypothetical protein
MSEEEKDKVVVGAATNLERTVPKFCSTMSFGLLQNKRNVIINMLFADDGSGTATLIERIIVDVEHLRAINSVITQILKDADDVSDNK